MAIEMFVKKTEVPAGFISTEADNYPKPSHRKPVLVLITNPLVERHYNEGEEAGGYYFQTTAKMLGGFWVSNRTGIVKYWKELDSE